MDEPIEDNNQDAIDFFSQLPDNYIVFEEQVDVKNQLDYFEASKKCREEKKDFNVLEIREKLFLPDTSIEEKKQILVQLASLENIEDFRVIEKYKNNPDPEMKDWAALAFIESKTLIENSLTDESHVIISSGLGGKKNCLRFFIVLFNVHESGFSDTQKKVLKTETEIKFSEYNSEIEEINFYNNYCTATCLIPVKTPVHVIFRSIIDECNLFGNFLKTNFIVTNVKKLSQEEIMQLEENNKVK